MKIRKFGDLYMDLDKFVFAYRFHPKVKGMLPGGTANKEGIRIGFIHGEITIHDDDPGYEELNDWLETLE
ncbi:MAG TPA: hypothetical protein VF823_07525 [Anaerolineales bacterium]